MRRSRKSTAHNHPVDAYARDVVEGRIVVGRLVRLAAQRHRDDREHAGARGVTFDEKAANAALEFFPRFLRHADGRPFVLAPFQQFIIGSLFGWQSAGVRRFRHLCLLAAKGNGKSPLAAGVPLCCLFLDGDAGSEIYCAAVTREQARIQFTDCMRMAQASPDLLRELDITENNIAMPSTGSFIRPVSSEARALDGKRVSVALIDELMEHPNADVYDKMRAGTKTHRQPLIIVTTNAGYDKLSVAWRVYDYSVKVLQGVHQNDTWLALIFALDPCADCRAAGHEQPNDECEDCDQWSDERTWPKANPLLDLALPRQYLREQVEEALAMPSKQSIVKRLNFSLWTSASVRWLPADMWAACGTEPIDRDALAGKSCVLGVDLGESHDMTAVVALFGDEEAGYDVLPFYVIAEAGLDDRARRDHAPYREWVRAGLIEAVPGPVVRFDVVRDRIKALATLYDLREIAIDRWRAKQLLTWLLEDGLPAIEMPPTLANIAPAAHTLERLLRTGMLRHGNHPVLAWNAANAVADVDALGNVRPSKVRSGGRIDGLSALCLALARASVQSEPRSVYDERGIITL